MSPIEQYNSIVDYWKKNPLVKGGEVHHIIPRSLGGCDKAWNKVRMATLDHIKCHRLLCDIYPSGSQHESMAMAYDFMLTTREGVKVSEEEAAWARDEMRKARSGKPTWNKGLHFSEEARRNISNAKRGKPGHKHTEEEREKMSARLKGRPNLSAKGRTPWNKGKHYKRSGPSKLLGRHYSSEHRQHMREAALRRWAKVKGNN